MGGASAPNTGVQTQALGLAVYGPELWPVMVPAPTIQAAGSTTLIDLENIQTLSRMAELGPTIGGNAASIQMQLQVDTYPLAVWSPNLGKLPYGADGGIRGVASSTLQLSQANTSGSTAGAAVISSLWIWQPTVADIVAFAPAAAQAGALSPATQAAYARQLAANPYLDSLRPQRPSELVAREYTPIRRKLYTPLTSNSSAAAAVGASGFTLVDVFPSTEGADFCVMEAMVFGPGAGVLADGAAWTCKRDGVTILNQFCYPTSLITTASPELPPFAVQTWIPAVQRLTLAAATTVSGQTFAVSPFGVLVGFYKFTQAIRYRWSLTAPGVVSVSDNPGAPNYVSPVVRDAVLAGWM